MATETGSTTTDDGDRLQQPTKPFQRQEEQTFYFNLERDRGHESTTCVSSPSVGLAKIYLPAILRGTVHSPPYPTKSPPTHPAFPQLSFLSGSGDLYRLTARGEARAETSFPRRDRIVLGTRIRIYTQLYLPYSFCCSEPGTKNAKHTKNTILSYHRRKNFQILFKGNRSLAIVY